MPPWLYNVFVATEQNGNNLVFNVPVNINSLASHLTRCQIKTDEEGTGTKVSHAETMPAA